MTLTQLFTQIANAIRSKKGTSAKITASDFPTEIASISTQGTYQHKSVTINSNTVTTVTPDVQYDAIDELTITTQVPQKQLQTKSYTFTENIDTTLEPDTGYDGFSSVDLSIDVPDNSPISQTDYDDCMDIANNILE